MFKPEYGILILKLVPNLIISKIRLRNPTSKTCPEPGCVEDFTGKTGRRLNERVIDHNGRDKKLHLYKHLQESNHPCVALGDFKSQCLQESGKVQY